MPGVTVAADSPALQGARSVVTGDGGHYILGQLPPGNYLVAFDFEGFRTLEHTIKVSAAQASRLDAEMIPAAVTGEITVTANYETISTAIVGAATYERTLVESLAIPRTYDATVLLAPGTDIGMGDNITMSGGLAYENQFMINGVSAMDNLRGYAHDVYIEDAIEETTVQTSGISAEYGRFAGGVVNMITRSGGNTLHGSYRLNLENDAWMAETPLSQNRQDEIGAIHELTLGGPIWKDRIWFFAAARINPGRDESDQTYVTQIPLVAGYTEDRWEVKATISPNPSHRITASYIDQKAEWTNYQWHHALDLDSVDEYYREDATLAALNYSGVLSDNFLLEAQYSAKTWDFVDRGRSGFEDDLVRGTPWSDWGRDNADANMAWWDAERAQDDRNNTDLLLKGTVFLPSERTGSHEIVFGYDRFDDMRDRNGFQTQTDFSFVSFVAGIVEGQDYYPVARPGGCALGWYPIDDLGVASSLVTESLFVNDSWRLTDRMSFNLGLRYDRNDGRDADGTVVADDDRLSPRIGAVFDVRGDGRWLLHGGFGRYVSSLSNGVANDTAAGGSPAIYGYLYTGDPINANGPPYLDSQEVIERLFAWFDAQGGIDAWHLLILAEVPGLTQGIPHGLKSPYTDEITLGFTARLGDEGMIRADIVHRQAHDFYTQKLDLTTGQVMDEQSGWLLDYGEFVNEDTLLERVYDGLHTQLQYRFSDRWTVAGTWTWSHLRGNWEGENIGNGPLESGILSYPEYQDPSWNAPRGDLFGDQRHKLRAWAVWNAVSTRRNNLSVSALFSYSTGRPYYAAREIDVGPYVDNPGYATPPEDTQTYFFSSRDAFRTDDTSSVNLAINYSFFFPALGTDFEVFIQPEVRNLFNQQRVVSVDDYVDVIGDFNPWTETPVEGVHYEYGPSFGQPVDESDYQLPREFRLSLGLRF